MNDKASAIITIIILLLGTLIIKAREFKRDQELKKQITTTKCEIAPINFEIQAEGGYGHFTIGIGNVKDKEYYFFYKVLPDGGKILEKSKCSETTIYNSLEKSEAARVEIDVDGIGAQVAIRLYLPKNTTTQEYMQCS